MLIEPASEPFVGAHIVMTAPSLLPLLDRHRVVLCVGSGGVGKTTVTAALGLAAAQRGKRVLCLTIDPAKRLANSLGLRAHDRRRSRWSTPALFRATPASRSRAA